MSAMQEEINGVEDLMEDVKKETIGAHIFYSGNFNTGIRHDFV